MQIALAASPETLFEMGQRGRQLIVDKFTWPAVAIRMRESLSVNHSGQPC